HGTGRRRPLHRRTPNTRRPGRRNPGRRMTNNDTSAINDRTVGSYLDALASSAPAPGGGSVAGLIGALAAGLGEMVVSLTRDPNHEILEAAATLTDLRASALASGAADEQAYGGYVEASKLPKD